MLAWLPRPHVAVPAPPSGGRPMPPRGAASSAISLEVLSRKLRTPALQHRSDWC